MSCSSDGTAVVWDADLNVSQIVPIPASDDELSVCAFLTVSVFILGCDDGTLSTWELRESGFTLKDSVAQSSAIISLAVSPDRSILATGSIDGTLHVFAADNLVDLNTSTFGNAIRSLCFAGISTIVVGVDGVGLSAFDLVSGRVSSSSTIMHTSPAAISITAYPPAAGTFTCHLRLEFL